jgi:hypothetical protein
MKLKTITAITFSALLAMAVTVVPASADEHHDRDNRHEQDRHRDDHRGGDRDYRRPPPVVYTPYYAPPPVVYGPSVGVYLPGLSIGIH